MNWYLLHPDMTMEHLGFLPEMLSEDDPAPARDQLNRAYRHGGGWRPNKGFTLRDNRLCYPGDPSLAPIAGTHLRDEIILLYPHDWVVIRQPDGSFEVARMD